MARKKKEVKLDNFYTIRYWMPVELKLSGTKLLVYAFIYAYSASSDFKSLGYYFGGHEVISKAVGCDKRHIPRLVDELKNMGLIEVKKAILNNGLKRCYYRVTVEPLETIDTEDTKDAVKAMERTAEAWANLSSWNLCIEEELEEESYAVRVF